MSCDFLTLAMPSIQSLRAYSPGKSIDELVCEQGLPMDTIVKLASNENPLGPPESALAAIQEALSSLSRYPDANGFYVKEVLSEKYNVDADQITLGNGSNDILVLLTECYLGVELSAIYSGYSFLIYALAIKAVGAKGVEVPSVDWGHDLDGMIAAIKPTTRMIFLANPNNPTGTVFTKEAFIAFLERVPEQVLVVIDEAYIEYGEVLDQSHSITLIQRFPNLVVVRTFSKAYGLAGCRVGYCISNSDIADILNRFRQPFNINSIAQVAAVAALKDSEYLSHSKAINSQGMAQLQSGVVNMGLDYIPSRGNFICINTGQNALSLYQRMLSKGIIVRPLVNYKMPQHLRISVGLPYENQRCIDVMQSVL